MTAYLLGSLPEAEAERMDELSFTDDEFSDTLKVAEKDLVDAYVQGELAGAELERFKTYYLASPLRRESVEVAQAFQSLTGQSAAAPAVPARTESTAGSATKSKGAAWFSSLSALASPRPALAWSFAALSLVLLIAGGWLAFVNTHLRQQVSQTQAGREALGRREQELQRELEGQRSASATSEQELARVREERERLAQKLKQQAAQAEERVAEQRRAQEQTRSSPPGGVSIASFILTPQMRSGVGQLPVVSIPARTDYVAMRLQLEPGDDTAYRVALLDQSGNQILWRSRQLKARATGDDKTLSISFPARLLSPQVYMLRVSGVEAAGASEIVSDYPFRVVK